jgi:DedD protein
MSDRLPDADRAVDEQKRRARRRLVGAIVLAAAAAVIVPMLLEKEPQPLGEDVSVQIPPVDEGKFVNRLTRVKPGDTAPTKAESKSAPTAAKPEPPKSEAAKPESSNAEAPKTAAPETSAATPAAVVAGVAAPSAPVAEATTPAASSKPIVAAESKMPTTPAAKAAPATDAKSAPAKAAPTPAPDAASTTAPVTSVTDAKSAPAAGFAVQLAAFSDDKGANAYANKLRKAGYASAHVEAVDTSQGKLWRVRVGGFATRAEAEAARVKLESKGFVNGMVAPAR